MAAHFAASHAMKEYDGAAADADRASNRRASIMLSDDDKPPGLDGALEQLTSALRPLLPERYRQFASVDQLVAAQPNLHSGTPQSGTHSLPKADRMVGRVGLR